MQNAICVLLIALTIVTVSCKPKKTSNQRKADKTAVAPSTVPLKPSTVPLKYIALQGGDLIDKQQVNVSVSLSNDASDNALVNAPKQYATCYFIKFHIKFNKSFTFPENRNITPLFRASLKGFNQANTLLFNQTAGTTVDNQAKLTFEICPHELSQLRIGNNKVKLIFKGNFVDNKGVDIPTNTLELSLSAVLELKDMIALMGQGLLYKVVQATNIEQTAFGIAPATNTNPDAIGEYDVYVKLDRENNTSTQGKDLKLLVHSLQQKELAWVEDSGRHHLDHSLYHFRLKVKQWEQQAGRLQVVMTIGDDLQTLIKTQLMIDIPAIYKTGIYFSHVQLNVQKAKEVLAGNSVFRNDFPNSTPETGVKISYRDKVLINTYARNSYRLYDPKTVFIYHYEPHNNLLIEVFDKDDFLNPDDQICSKRVNFKELEATDYKNLRLSCTDEFYIYTKNFGKIN